MVRPFQFARVPSIIFRQGLLADLPGHIKPAGNRIALVTGKSSFIHSQHAEKLLEELRKNNISCHLISINGEPSPEDIDGAVQALKDEGTDMVVGIGGGSVLDAGKAISSSLRVCFTWKSTSAFARSP